MSGCFLKLKEALPTLPKSEQRTAKYILENPDKIASLSIGELANRCDTSKATVIRLCKSLGYKGYKEFKAKLLGDIANNGHEQIKYTDIILCNDLGTLAKGVCANNVKSIENTLSILDMNELEKAVDTIIAAKRVDFYGVGISGLVALDAQNKFLRINKISVVCTDSHQQILAAASLKKGDVAVMISYSGETKDILETLEMIKESEATVISITRYGKNSLSKASDIRIYTASLEPLLRSGATGSRIAQLTVIDILFSAVISREYSEIKGFLDKTTIAYEHKKTADYTTAH